MKFNFPPFLLDKSDVVDAIKIFVRENLDSISVKKVHGSTHEQVMIHVAGRFLDRTWSEDDNKSCFHTVHNDIISISKKEVLRFYELHELSITTVYEWMNIMGMKYCNHKKIYYVDRNEKNDVINERSKFVQIYLTNELSMYRWVQITLKEEIRLNVNSGGYKYFLP